MIRQLFASIRAFAPAPRALAPLLLAALVAALAAGPAQAVGPSVGPTSSARAIAAAAEAGESEEEEEEEEEVEIELEFEEGEEAGEEGALPAECRLHTATPQVVARFGRGDMRLTLRYTSDSALRIGVSYWLKGAKGTLRLGSTTRRIGRRGVIALSRHLDERSLAKLRVARTIVVQLAVPDTPRSCRRYLTMRLSPMHPLSSGATRYEPA
jgi:hypothetical protein